MMSSGKVIPEKVIPEKVIPEKAIRENRKRGRQASLFTDPKALSDSVRRSKRNRGRKIPGGSPEGSPKGRSKGNPKESSQRSRDRRIVADPHLRAAIKLSRNIKKLPDFSQEQILTGQAICRHLRAMLDTASLKGEHESRESAARPH